MKENYNKTNAFFGGEEEVNTGGAKIEENTERDGPPDAKREEEETIENIEELLAAADAAEKR